MLNYVRYVFYMMLLSINCDGDFQQLEWICLDGKTNIVVLQQVCKGIELLYHFVQMRVFCRDAYTAKSNFDQLVNRMAYLFNIVKNELAKEMMRALRALLAEQF